ncbi:divergent polysaccharide deacetylase family protein [Alteromonas halophila]|uniref:Divergent polysaccharide deacetylase family protein n=1 Tax=Alteromonas halophila TaxID=516698 RepID=A0A918JJL1_9ALTE|nr:divergent polysaccharide deacetylase family protein [Alteromonas halophila]GGW79127.1 hypothetical protein GCM10007391_09770 [Alteromonas halophila]
MRKHVFRHFGFTVLAVLACMLMHSAHASEKPGIVIIIDDLGYRQSDKQALLLPKAVVFSILPDTPLATQLSRRADDQGRDVMLHLPMQALSNNRLLGPRALTADMYPSGIASTLEAALKSVPNARGLNNHMGSLLTGRRRPMQALMYEIHQRGLFFVDSRTTSESLAQRVAQEHGVPSAHRHVFIDHQQSETFMNQQLRQLETIAQQHGVAIGIAHPHPSTLAFLSEQLPELNARGIELISMSTYFARQQPARLGNSVSGARVAAPR